MRRCDAGGKMAGPAVAATGLGLLALAGGAADEGILALVRVPSAPVRARLHPQVALALARAPAAATAIVIVIVTATAATVIPSRK